MNNQNETSAQPGPEPQGAAGRSSPSPGSVAWLRAPNEEGWWWCARVGSKFTLEGTIEAVKVEPGYGQDLWAEGFGEMELHEVGYAWAKANPPWPPPPNAPDQRPGQ